MFIGKAEIYFVLKITGCHVLETFLQGCSFKSVFCNFNKVAISKHFGGLHAFNFHCLTLSRRSIYLALALKLSRFSGTFCYKYSRDFFQKPRY